MAHRDPHAVLGVAPGASQATVKAAWRRLAREHHPDLAANAAERRAATRRMAAINAAYNELRKRPAGTGDRGGQGRAGRGPRGGSAGTGPGGSRHGPEPPRPTGPPPPPPTRPVTARLDTSDLMRPRNATTTPRGEGYRHHPRGAYPPRPRPGARRSRPGRPTRPVPWSGSGHDAADAGRCPLSRTLARPRSPSGSSTGPRSARSPPASPRTSAGWPARSPAIPTCSTPRGSWRCARRGRRAVTAPRRAAGRPAPGAPPMMCDVGPAG